MFNNTVNLVNVKQQYKKITQEFCKHYYNLYDNNFGKLSNLYKPEACFTFLDEDMIGFNNLYDKIKLYNIFKFQHHTVNVNSHPVGDKTLLITATGKISINNSLIEQRYTETILLQRDDYNNFFVYHTIFKLLE